MRRAKATQRGGRTRRERVDVWSAVRKEGAARVEERGPSDKGAAASGSWGREFEGLIERCAGVRTESKAWDHARHALGALAVARLGHAHASDGDIAGRRRLGRRACWRGSGVACRNNLWIKSHAVSGTPGRQFRLGTPCALSKPRTGSETRLVAERLGHEEPDVLDRDVNRRGGGLDARQRPCGVARLFRQVRSV